MSSDQMNLFLTEKNLSLDDKQNEIQQKVQVIDKGKSRHHQFYLV